MKEHHHPNLVALFEVGLLFLPAIPAYLWVWPNLQGAQVDIFQLVTYCYVLAGTLVIGLRRWNWQQLGLNLKGLWLTLACGLVILLARLLIIFSIQWTVSPARLSWTQAAIDLLFYFCAVGLTEELLFRGLVYRILEDWRGPGWAIWGSSFGFLLWHIFGQGPLAGFAGLLIGLLFALIRWRGGGITGLIVLHGLWDLETVWLVSGSNAEILDLPNIAIANLTLLRFGAFLLFSVPAYLIWGHPVLERYRQRRAT